MESNKNNFILKKIVIIGDANVGKSSIIRRFFDGDFINHYNCGIGIDFHTINFFVPK